MRQRQAHFGSGGLKFGKAIKLGTPVLDRHAELCASCYAFRLGRVPPIIGVLKLSPIDRELAAHADEF